MVVTRHWGRERNGGLLVNEDKVSIWGGVESSGDGWGGAAAQQCERTRCQQAVQLKMTKTINLTLHAFYHNKVNWKKKTRTTQNTKGAPAPPSALFLRFHMVLPPTARLRAPSPQVWAGSGTDWLSAQTVAEGTFWEVGIEVLRGLAASTSPQGIRIHEEVQTIRLERERGHMQRKALAR